jgi:mono/diheme cytochrome c family protein
MNYPFWDIPFGYGILMAIIAIVHVFVSHFAIGGGLYLVVSEHFARRDNDTERLDYLQGLSKFFILVTLVFGALTGVAIWFIIGLLNPAATEMLIHTYVWGWATEWTFFVIEIIAAILYYYGWKTMSAKNHLVLGWIYFIAAWMSLFIINGIICFMLTPGDWLMTGNFWDGFFNPTFWPSLVFRTGICIMLAGLYAILVASRYKATPFKAKQVRYNAYWGVAGLAIMVPTFYWYWKAIPAEITGIALEAMPTPMAALSGAYINVGLIALVLILFGLVIPKRFSFPIAIILMIFGLSVFGEFEWFRESIRKPYVVTNYMFGNAVEVTQVDKYEDAGYLASIVYKTGDDGADLFRRACRSCHTIDGYKPLKPAFDGTDEAFIASIVRGTQVLKGNMPPFRGTVEESELIAAHLYPHIDTRHIADIYDLQGVELGKKVYDIRCGTCHEIGGYNDKYESLVDLTEEEYNDILDVAGDLGEEMPDFTGDDREREALIQYFMTLGKGDGNAPSEL